MAVWAPEPVREAWGDEAVIAFIPQQFSFWDGGVPDSLTNDEINGTVSANPGSRRRKHV